MKSILVPVDLSEGTVKVCEAAARLARKEGCRLILLHVVPPTPDPENDYYLPDPERIMEVVESNRKLAADKLDALGRWVRRLIPDTEVMMYDGTPATVIVGVAKALRTDYIVMGSRGHGIAFELLVGGTKRAVMRKSPCPVMAVPIGDEPSEQLAASGTDNFLAAGLP